MPVLAQVKKHDVSCQYLSNFWLPAFKGATELFPEVGVGTIWLANNIGKGVYGI